MKQKIVISVVLIALFLGSVIQYRNDKIPLKSIESIPKNSRLLVVAPHCDDETLGGYGLMKQVLNKQGKVKVIIVTNGEGDIKSAKELSSSPKPKSSDYIHVGYIRQKESLAAMKTIGLSKNDIIFLGYPSGRTLYMWDNNWIKSKPIQDKEMKLKHSPYKNSYTLDASYAGENEAQDLVKIIKDFQPTIILFPHPKDDHPEHKATYAFTKYSIVDSKVPINSQLLYLVHYANWENKRLNEKCFLKPPKELRNIGTTWKKLDLSRKVQFNKKEAIQLYKTQMRRMSSFLLSFNRRNELFGEYSDVPIDILIDHNPKIIIEHHSNLKNIFGNIQNIEMWNDKDYIYLRMNIQNKLKQYVYKFDLTFFYKDKRPNRIGVEVNNDQLNITSITSNDFQIQKYMTAKITKNSITLKIPTTTIPDIENLFLGGMIFKGNKKIDGTAFRLIHFY